MINILCLVQLPPPIHGASLMNQHVINTLHNSGNSIRTIELKFVKKVSQIGSISFMKIFRMFYIAYKIVRTLISFKPDIVYFTLSPFGGAFYRDVLFVCILKLFRVKIVFHLHGKGIKKNLLVWWKKMLYMFVFENTTVIHLSPLLEEDIINIGYRDIHFIPNGIDSFKGKEAKFNRSNAVVQLIFLSNLTISKGLLVLLDACKILKDNGREFKLNIIGKEFDITFDELKLRIKNLKLSDNINLLGPKYNDEKYQYLYNSDIFVFPTYYPNECFPLVLLEAMQASLPIISTYEGAISEIVDDKRSGLLVKQNDVKDLADKLEILIEDIDLRLQMGRAGRQKYLERYTLEKFEDNIKEFFNNIIDAK